jgi:hypothetical protein
MQATLAYCRATAPTRLHRTPDVHVIATQTLLPWTLARLRAQEGLLTTLRDPATPWDRRLVLLDCLARSGWSALPEWKQLEPVLRYRGSEWAIPLPDDQLRQLERLRGRKRREALARIQADWLEKHPELQGPILGDRERLSPLLVWVALRLWVTTTQYSAWLSSVIDSALGAINHASLPALYQQVSGHPKAVLWHEAYTALVGDVIPRKLPRISGRIADYLNAVARNTLRRVLRRGPVDPAEDLEHRTAPVGQRRVPERKRPRAGRTALEELQELSRVALVPKLEWLLRLELALAFDQFLPHLTPRQAEILSLYLDGVPQAEIGCRMKPRLSLSTVEHELTAIRATARLLSGAA